VTEFNDISKNSLKNDVNEKVREAFNRYHNVSLETFQKILDDKDVKHQEVINILTSRLLVAKAERDESISKLNSLEQILEVKTREIEAKSLEIEAREREIKAKDIEIKSRESKIEAIAKDAQSLAVNHNPVSELKSEVKRLSESNTKKRIALNELEAKIEQLKNLNRIAEEDKHKLSLDKLSIEAKLSDILENHNRKVSEIKEKYEIRISEIKDFYNIKISEFKDSYELKLSGIKSGYETKIVELKDNSDAKIAEVKSSYELKISDIKHASDERIVELSELKSQKENLEQQNSELKSQKENLEQQNSDLLSERDEFQTLIVDIRRDAEGNEETLRNEISMLNKMLEESIELAERVFKDNRTLEIRKYE